MRGLVCLLFIIGLSFSSEAQDQLSDFRSPSNPANIILGNEPSTILRPTSPQAIGTSVSSFLDDGSIKPNVGMELCPFWLFKSDKKEQQMTFEQYTNQDIKKDDKQFLTIAKRSLSRNFAVSVATADATTLKGVNIGIGARTKLFEIYPNAKIQERVIRISEEMHIPFIDWVQTILLKNAPAQDNCSGKDKKACFEQSIKVLEKLISYEFQKQGDGTSLQARYENTIAQVASYNESYDTFRASIKNGIELFKSKNAEIIAEAIVLSGSDPIKEKESRELILEAFEKILSNSPEVTEKISDYTELIEDVKAGTRLFSVDVAYANLLNAPTAGFEKIQVQQHSFWVTASYSPNALGPFELTGVFRHDVNYQHNNDTISSILSNYGGLRITYAKDKFNVSVEALGSRSQYKNKNIGDEIKYKDDYRISINFEYRISDLICFNFAFGRTFKDNVLVENIDPMLLVGGVNLALPKHLKM